MRKQTYRPPPEYSVWVMMKQRCYNAACKDYGNYGGRGIGVSPEWRESYKAFIADMGPRPGKKYTLERKDNSKDYCKDNCVWATRREQSLNKRDNRIITIDGVSKTMQEWAEEKGIHQATLSNRINDMGWDEKSAVMLPAGSRLKTPAKTVFIEVDGVTKSIKEWVEYLGITRARYNAAVRKFASREDCIRHFINLGGFNK